MAKYEVMASSRVVFALLALLALLPVDASWTIDTAVTVDLTYPPMEKSDYAVRYGEFLPGYGQGDATFECSMMPLDPNQKRYPFPTIGGFMYTTTRNETGGLETYKYITTSYLGQITGDETANMSRWAYIDTLVYKDMESERCTEDAPVNASALMENAFLDIAPAINPITDASVLDPLGKNATLGFRTVLFDNDGNNIEEMIQCGYITFVTPDEFSQSSALEDVCGDSVASSLPSSTGIDIVPTTLATSTSVQTSTSAWRTTVVVATDTPTYSPTPGTNKDKGGLKPTAKVEIAAFVSTGACAIFFIAGCIFLHRRRKNKGTISQDFFEGFGRRKNGDKEKKSAVMEAEKGVVPGEKKDAILGEKDVGKELKSKETEPSESGSIHSEQLPSYKEAIKD